jgi:hypothetical protein
VGVPDGVMPVRKRVMACVMVQTVQAVERGGRSTQEKMDQASQRVKG